MASPPQLKYIWKSLVEESRFFFDCMYTKNYTRILNFIWLHRTQSRLSSTYLENWIQKPNSCCWKFTQSLTAGLCVGISTKGQGCLATLTKLNIKNSYLFTAHSKTSEVFVVLAFGAIISEKHLTLIENVKCYCANNNFRKHF
jgi:hypothetical protein